MDQPLVTVVIPFYSKDKSMLKRSVTSALDQSYGNVEVIVVDDSSPVTATEELRGISDNRLKIIRNSRNRNGAYSRNAGILAAGGEYVALLDADDCWKRDHLMVCVENICEFDFLYSNTIVVRNGAEEFKEVSDIADCATDRDRIADILLTEPPQTNSFFFRRSCYPEVKFDESLRRHQDYQFFIDFCLSDFKIKKVNVFTSYYFFVFRPENIDYYSVIRFWKSYRRFSSYRKLNKFILDLAVASVRFKGIDRDLLFLFSSEVIPENKVFGCLLRLRNDSVFRVLLFSYYLFFVDFSRLFPRLYKYVRR